MRRYLCLVFFAFFGTVSLFAQVPLTEIQALKTFYDATGGPNWFSENDADPTNDWNFATPLANTVVTNDWYGLFLTGNHVTYIDMNPTGLTADRNNLVGTLPEEIADLRFLQTLDLEIGELSGPIPNSITTLTDLTNLNLRNNEFTGPIPSAIGNLTNLRRLRLGSNELTGQIPLSLLTLGNLNFLSLRHNDLSGDIPLGITNMTSLTTLYLGSNDFTGFIYPEYGNLVNLTHLGLGANQLTGTIPTELGNLVNMQNLSLGSNDLTGTLPVSLGNLLDMRSIDITYTQISGSIPEEYGNWSNPRSISLGRNELEGVIPPQFANFPNLEIFSVQYNRNMEGPVPDFSGIASLRYLYIAGNQYQFGDFENEFGDYNTNLTIFRYESQAPVGMVENHSVCVGGSITLQTVVSGSANVYEWFKDGTALPASNTPNYTITDFEASDAGAYTCSVSSTIVTGLVIQRQPITLTVDSAGPTANTVADVYACDTDTDGYATFTLDLSDIEAQVIGGQTGLTVSYFDAMGNPLALTATYTNTNPNQQDVTVRVETSAGCYDETVFSLIVHPVAVAEVFPDVNICAGERYFLGPLSLTDNLYYTGPNKTGMVLIAGDEVFDGQTVYVYAETGFGANTCSDESSFQIRVSGTLADEMADVQVCDSYVLPALSPENAYYTIPNGDGNRLEAGDVIDSSQMVYIYTEEGTCSDETDFFVEVTDTPMVTDEFEDVQVCIPYELPELSPGNSYYTLPNGGGVRLDAGDVIDTTRTIYIYAASGTCSSETDFTVEVLGMPVADVFDDQAECDVYVLPGLSTGNSYYTGPDKSGQMLEPGDAITSSQTVYIYAEGTVTPDLTCFDESSFSVTITTTEAVILEDVSDCNAYILPVLPEGQRYFTEADGGGTVLEDGDQISETRTIYIRAEHNGCFAESSFRVIIEPEACQTEDLSELPKFFTPNGDGSNDLWDTAVLSGRSNIRIHIYDRYGRLLAQLDPDTNSAWDGFHNGKPMPSSDYWYRFVDYDSGQSLSGHFTLKR